MEDIINLIATDSTPSEISDSIKNALYMKATERVNELKPQVAASMFDSQEETN